MPARRTTYQDRGFAPCALLASLAGFLAGTTDVTAGPLNDAAAEFLAAVDGDWRGRAVRTPAGLFSYDIRFAPDRMHCASGVAEPGGVHHHWKFCPADAGLGLEFLSDFGGNERPLFLQLHDIDAGTLVFHSETHGFLKVLARIEEDCLRLQVLHHDRLHVEIHLRRASPGTGPAETGDCPWAAPVSDTP